MSQETANRRQKPLVFIASDHAGYALKARVLSYLKERGYEAKDLGPESDHAVDYPHYAHLLAEKVKQLPDCLGVLLCGTGNGMSMSANKHIGIRAAVCWHVEVAKRAREHNHANILCVPSWFLSPEEGEKILLTFLETEVQGGRHERRVQQISLFGSSKLT